MQVVIGLSCSELAKLLTGFIYLFVNQSVSDVLVSNFAKWLTETINWFDF